MSERGSLFRSWLIGHPTKHFKEWTMNKLSFLSLWLVAFCRAPYCYYWANSSGLTWCQGDFLDVKEWAQVDIMHQLGSTTNLLHNMPWPPSLTSSKCTQMGWPITATDWYRWDWIWKVGRQTQNCCKGKETLTMLMSAIQPTHHPKGKKC